MREGAPGKAPWLKVRVPRSRKGEAVRAILDDLGLNTVCQEASCPNIGECWSKGTATFMVLGDTCTRQCRFCEVKGGFPFPPDPGEPERVAKAAARLGLRHIVVTSVTRDDLPDGGAAHFATTIQALRQYCPDSRVEVLIPDFGGSLASLEIVIAACPDILNHNMETVNRLYPVVRPQASYRRSLGVLAWAKGAGLVTKSGLMLGLGETRDEVLETMKDLRGVRCDILTLGQYLRPSPRHLKVERYIPPEEFEWYKGMAEGMGFQKVASAPLVRSSYQAEELAKTPGRT